MTFLVGGAAQLVRPAGRRGGTPTRGWWQCLRHGPDPFRNCMPLPRLLLRALCEPSVIGFDECYRYLRYKFGRIVVSDSLSSEYWKSKGVHVVQVMARKVNLLSLQLSLSLLIQLTMNGAIRWSFLRSFVGNGSGIVIHDRNKLYFLSITETWCIPSLTPQRSIMFGRDRDRRTGRLHLEQAWAGRHRRRD